MRKKLLHNEERNVATCEKGGKVRAAMAKYMRRQPPENLLGGLIEAPNKTTNNNKCYIYANIHNNSHTKISAMTWKKQRISLPSSVLFLFFLTRGEKYKLRRHTTPAEGKKVGKNR
jgi:hypothetical protein